MSCTWLAIGIVVGVALATLVTGAWMVWRDRAEDEIDTDFMTDYPQEGL